MASDLVVDDKVNANIARTFGRLRSHGYSPTVVEGVDG